MQKNQYLFTSLFTLVQRSFTVATMFKGWTFLISFLAGFFTNFSAFSAEFISVKDLSPQEQQQIASYQAAIHNIVVSPSSCTASLISDRGHLLTAQHCLHKYLLNSNLTKRLIYKTSHRKVNIHQINNSALQNHVIAVEFPQLFRGSKSLKKNYKIAALGSKGWIQDENITKLSVRNLRSLLDQGFSGLSNEGDFVILEPLSNRDSLSVGEKYFTTSAKVIEPFCLQLAEDPPQINQNVFSLGFPSYQRKAQTVRSELSFTFGKVTDSMPLLFSPQRVSLELEIRPFEKILLNDLDFAPGASGSPVLNQYGKILGISVASYQMDSKSSRFNSMGSTVSVNAQHVVSYLNQKYGTATTRAFFNCSYGN